MRLIVLLIVISLLGCSIEEKKILELKIESTECPGCQVQLLVVDPFDFRSTKIDSFNLDNNGFSRRNVTLEQPYMSVLTIGDSIRFSLFIKGGENLKITSGQSVTQFSGSLSILNKSLFKTDQIQSQFENINQKFILNLVEQDFFNRLDSLQEAFSSIIIRTKFLSRYDLETIKNIHRLKILQYKYNYALMHYNFYQGGHILPKKISNIEKIPDSPESINLAVVEYGALARMYLDMILYPKFWPKTESLDSTRLFFLRVDSLLKESSYSSQTKEFLRAVNIDMQMTPNGNMEILDKVFLSYQSEIENPKHLRKLIAKHESLFRVEKGSIAPNIIGYNSKNEKVELIDLINKPVVIDVWATWCKPCIESLPEMKKIESEYDSSEVSFLYISLDTSHEKWRSFNQENLNDRLSIIECDNSSIYSDYLIGGIPRYIIINSKGQIFNANVSGPKTGEMRKQIDEVINLSRDSIF